MRRHTLIYTAACVACLSLACSKPSKEDPAPTSSAEAEPEGHDPCDDDHKTGSSKLLHPTPTTTTDKDGNTVTHFGPAFAIEERTTVATIQKEPDALLTKKVHMEGFVTAGCKRRRGWFAIVDDRRSGNPMRVLTTPSFRVPADAIGKRVRVEGTVTKIEIPAATARHMAKEHSLPMPEQTTGDIAQTVLLATSADFY